MSNNQKGQSLIEVMVAAMVGILVVSALTFATLFSLRNATFSKTSAQATKLAQEGIERVRSGRDRNAAIDSFQLGSPLEDVTSWNDPDLWLNQISTNCTPNCYFNVDSSGALAYKGNTPLFAEVVAPNFKRSVILYDGPSSFSTQKTITVIVTWTDSTGPHESKLTTILRKL